MLLLFYTSNTLLSSFLIYNFNIIFFYTIVTFFVVLPLVCLILFALDVYYGLFCIDTSFVFVFIWLLIPAFFTINLFSYLLKVFHA